MRKKFINNSKIYLIYSFLLSFISFSQNLPQIYPTTPEASQLEKFVDMPVSLHNGTPNISIPIYTIKVKGLEIPVCISYHAKGIQVTETSSRVGAGWVLNAGGAITRQVMGIEDDRPTGYLNKNFIENFSIDYNVRFNRFSEEVVESNMTPPSFDEFPDIFSFNFLGYSGKFIINQVTKKPVLQKYDDLKILIEGSSDGYSNGEISSFTVITPDGNEFLFSVTDRTNKKGYIYYPNSTGTINLENYGNSLPTAWYLSRIKTPEGETVNFEYEVETVTHYELGQIKHNESLNYTKNISYQNQLKRVLFGNNEYALVINKDTANDRQDLCGAKELNTIDICKVVNGINNSYLKRFRFNHFYTTSTDDSYNSVFYSFKIFPCAANESKKRLFLSSIDEININNLNIDKTTRFEYNQVILPNRFSNATDSWGYYNGVHSNHYLKTMDDVSRIVNNDMNKAGILEKIIYPTGGYTLYEYEDNIVKRPLYYNELILNNTNPTESKSVGLMKDYSKYNITTFKYNEIFEIKNLPTEINFVVSFTNDGCLINAPALSTCKYKVELWRAGGGFVAQLVLGNNNIILQPGFYRIEVTPKGIHHLNEFIEEEEFFVQGIWQEIKQHELLFAGGKRIKKMTIVDRGAIHIEKEFLYIEQNGTTSGENFCLPLFLNTVHLGSQLIGTSHCYRSIVQFSGSNLGYSRVIEIQTGNNEKIKTIYTFTNFPNEGQFYKIPYHIPTDMEWTRGLPLKIENFKYSNNNYMLVKSTENNYQFYGTCITPSLISENSCINTNFENNSNSNLTNYLIDSNKFKYPIYSAGKYWDNNINSPCNLTDPNCYRTSYFIGGRLSLVSSVEKNYYSGSNNTLFLMQSINNTYSSGNHNQKTSQTTTNSKGETLETKYYYAPDPELTNEPYKTDLIAKNMIGIPLLTQTFKNGIKLSEQKTQYSKDASTNNLLLPKYIKTKKGTDADQPNLETKITYNSYDNKGNLTQYTLESGIPVSIIWGYNQTQPIAKIENASYSQVSSYVNNLQTLSNGTNEASLLTALDALRSNLPNAMVTTYTYIPLVGVSTITDPKADRQTFTYDNFGRLQYVKDKNGNILSENQYHYRP